MASLVVNSKDMIIPDVYAQLVTEKVNGQVKVAQLADNLGAIVNKEVGETITFPKWKRINDASDITPGTAMTSVEMEQTTDTASIKMIAAPGIKVYDYDNMVTLGNAIQEGANQQGTSIARKLDADLIADAYNTPFRLKIAEKNKVTEAELLSALELYGDERDTNDFAAIVCHSKFATSFYGMDGFVKRDLTYVAEANGATVVNGIIGSYMGVPVVLSDRLYDSTNTEGYMFIVKKHSLGYMPKENPFVEVSRNASLRCTEVFCSQVYATKLIADDGIVLLKTVLPTLS